MLDVEHLADILTERFGVPLVGESTDEQSGKRARFIPRDIAKTQGFVIQVLIGWRTIEAEFVLGTFAAPLLKAMETSSGDQRAAFNTFIRAAVDDGAVVTFKINNQDADPMQEKTWPQGWRSVVLGMQKGPLVIDPGNPATVEELVLRWGGRTLGAVLSIMPLERIDSSPTGEAEGGERQVLITRYERSHINRAACIEIQGSRCKVCGFDFDEVYGIIGRGFIEVHHLEMVSMLAPGAVVNPAKDLVPVCANCHAMLHRRTPPYTTDELTSIIAKVSGVR